MLHYNDLKFDTSMRVLFKLKEKYGHKTLQETYGLLQENQIDTMYDILLLGYNLGNKTNLTIDEFLELLNDKQIGFIKLTDLFSKFIESLMFDGLSEEERAAQKNLLEKLTKN